MAPRKDSSQSEKAHALMERRAKQQEDIISIVGVLEECISNARKMRSQHSLLSSVSKGLYEELDKLSKKAPAEPVTELVLIQVNDVIREIKELAIDDSYVQRLKEFVAAGDNPEQRDVVVVLRQLRQGLERFAATIDPRIDKFTHKKEEANTIQLALQLFMNGKRNISHDEMEDYGIKLSQEWFNEDSSEELAFNWNRLDSIDLRNYFPTCE